MNYSKKAVQRRMTAASALTVEIEERFLHCVARHANTACRKKPRYSGRNDTRSEARPSALGRGFDIDRGQGYI